MKQTKRKKEREKFRVKKNNVFSSGTLKDIRVIDIASEVYRYFWPIGKHPYSGVIYRRARKSGTETLAVFIGADIGYSLASREHSGGISKRSARVSGHIPTKLPGRARGGEEEEEAAAVAVAPRRGGSARKLIFRSEHRGEKSVARA